ncbi:pantothenate synthetase [Nitrosomonas sp. PY1]|uniref:pantoate--beta-alanine ligase n=1 Tax=Nitrosomonas sp. PY1 TaxID=1803906 RepID=UPI001FC808AB|nr:pantoate--beta-alanine ligase [Nitrosomonas sp. PY1]GKS68022.1 pantothenate synthetase [Nitrosomonas sp. PY1]
MKIFRDIPSIRAHLQNLSSIAFVPTMGNLHAGHLALIKQAKQLSSEVVVSIFVNRLQFLPHEDFSRYPRTIEQDCLLLEELNVNTIFIPDEKILFPTHQEFLLALPPIADTLEGKFRPGFFRGVTTIVLKLFNIIQPNLAIFGKKDYQQLYMVQEMVKQLNLPIEIIAGETVRASDGLALSSRNQYLDPSQRIEASNLYQTLLHIKKEIISNNKDFQVLQEEATQRLTELGWKVDYVQICDRASLSPACYRIEPLVVLVAAWLAKTRLIDNIEV